MILFLDTSQKERVIIAMYERNSLKKRKVIKIRNHHSEVLVESIDALLKTHALNLKFLRGIAVVSGGGGFSALRIGITCANTLAWALKVPVFGVRESDTKLSEKKFVEILFKKLKKAKLGIFVTPLYGKEPNITYQH